MAERLLLVLTWYTYSVSRRSVMPVISHAAKHTTSVEAKPLAAVCPDEEQRWTKYTVHSNPDESSFKAFSGNAVQRAIETSPMILHGILSLRPV